MKVVSEAGGLAALVEQMSIQQQKLVDESNKKLLGQVEESNRKMLGQFLDEAEKKAEARVLASEEKVEEGICVYVQRPPERGQKAYGDGRRYQKERRKINRQELDRVTQRNREREEGDERDEVDDRRAQDGKAHCWQGKRWW